MGLAGSGFDRPAARQLERDYAGREADSHTGRLQCNGVLAAAGKVARALRLEGQRQREIAGREKSFVQCRLLR